MSPTVIDGKQSLQRSGIGPRSLRFLERMLLLCPPDHGGWSSWARGMCFSEERGLRPPPLTTRAPFSEGAEKHARFQIAGQSTLGVWQNPDGFRVEDSGPVSLFHSPHPHTLPLSPNTHMRVCLWAQTEWSLHLCLWAQRHK